MNLSTYLKKAENVLLFLTFFLFPLLFLPLFTNAFAVPKLVFLAVIFVALLVLKTVRMLVDRKLELFSSQFDTPLFLLMFAFLLSVVVSAPNKVEALLDPSRGALLIVLLVLNTLLLPKNKQLVIYASLASLAISFAVTFLGYFSFFSFLPKELAFLNTKGFNLMGNLIGQGLMGGYFVALAIDSLKDTHPGKKEGRLLLNSLFIVGLLSAVLSAFILVKDIRPAMLPFANAWQITVDVLKTAQTAFFGVGPANYLSLYTLSKPMAINGIESLWNANVEFSRSGLLHILTEVGILGLFSIGLIFFKLSQEAKKNKSMISNLFLIFWLVLMPSSQIFFFVLILAVFLNREVVKVKEIDLRDLDIFTYGLSAVSLAVVILFAYFFFYRALGSEYYLGLSAQALAKNEGQKVYEYQRMAVSLNPFNEKARGNFAQINLLLANNIARKKKLTDEDKKNVTTLIQQGIAEAKALVSLNPGKAVYWANLGEVYRGLLGVAQGAEEWTISAYQRAIALDPRNPEYYFNLGSVYFGLQKYPEAVSFFDQAVSLKGNMANYYYNLAWALYNAKDYVRAANVMEYTLRFVTPGSKDYKKVNTELGKFKEMLPKEETKPAASEKPVVADEQLTQPTPVPTGATIKLPEESAPPVVTVTPANAN